MARNRKFYEKAAVLLAALMLVQAVPGPGWVSASAGKEEEKVDSSIAYFVDAGAYDVSAPQGEDKFGVCNRVLDQEYGIDEVTGYAWGYVGETVPYYDTRPGMTKEESCRFGNSGWDFGYRFALEEGTYDVEIYIPKEVPQRVFDIYISDSRGERKLTQAPVEAAQGPAVIYGSVESSGTEAETQIDFKKPDGSYWDPVVSYLILYDHQAATENFYTLLEEAKAYRKEDYREESWEALQAVIEEAERTSESNPEYPGKTRYEEMKKIRTAMEELRKREERTVTFLAEERTGGEIPDSSYQKSGQGYQIPEEVPVRKGYEFEGWSFQGSCYRPGDSLVIPEEDVVLKAQWARRNTVSFQRNGGSGTLPEKVVGKAGTTFVLPDSPMKKNGCTFGGWSDGESVYFPGSEFTIPEQDLVLKAVWEENPVYAISFQSGGGVGELPWEMVSEAGDLVIIPECALKREGFRFTGWRWGEKIFQPGDFLRMPKEQMVLIAQWEPEPGRQPDREPGEQVSEEKPPVRYTVRFLSGGTALRSQSVTEGERVLEPERPKRKGYAFAGWYLGERKYSFEAGVKGNLDLTAKWKKVTVGKGNLLRVKNKKKGKAAVAIKKTAGAEGYQISYAQDRKFQKAGKRIATEKRSLTVRKLKKGKTYYFRVRAYKLDSWGRKVYGKYSGIRKLYMRK